MSRPPVVQAAGPRVALRQVAKELGSLLDAASDPDALAYAALTRDGEVCPWTSEAEAAWRRAGGSDPWRNHHLAVLHHARAYELEADRPDEAHEHWVRALACWARLHADDGFWGILGGHVSAALGIAVPVDALAAVRARLPAELLDPHADLIEAYRQRAPDRARAHMVLIKSSAFPPVAVEAVRASLVGPVLDRVDSAVRTARLDEMAEDLGSWLAIDEDHPGLVRALLHVRNKQCERAVQGEGGLEVVSAISGRAAREVRPALGKLGPPAGALAGELARHRYWLGCASRWAAYNELGPETSQQAFRRSSSKAGEAVGHLRRASALDPDLEMYPLYGDRSRVESMAEQLRGWATFNLRGSGDTGPDLEGAAEQFRRAVELDPESAQAHALLVRALVTLAATSGDAVREAETVIARAKPVVDRSGTAQDRSMLAQSQSVLAQRKRLRGSGGW